MPKQKRFHEVAPKNNSMKLTPKGGCVKWKQFLGGARKRCQSSLRSTWCLCQWSCSGVGCRCCSGLRCPTCPVGSWNNLLPLQANWCKRNRKRYFVNDWLSGSRIQLRAFSTKLWILQIPAHVSLSQSSPNLRSAHGSSLLEEEEDEDSSDMLGMGLKHFAQRGRSGACSTMV